MMTARVAARGRVATFEDLDDHHGAAAGKRVVRQDA
jgi:hypothetical protein